MSNLVWPRPLKPGGTIGICSPAGASPPGALERGKAALEARGYAAIIAPHAGDTHANGYLAGADEARAGDLNTFLRDPSIDLVLCARGGYGSARLLDMLDYEAAKADPKPLVGYSDITALSLALAARAGVVSFSGIMATAGDGFGEETLDPWSEASFWQAVGDAPFPRVLAPPPDAPPWEILRGPATVSGPVIAVCLSLLISLVGTPFVPNLDGAVLVIEDVHEDLYAVDRALTQLRLAGLLDNLSALLLGSFNGTPEQDEILRIGVPRLAADLAPPTCAVASGVAYGHIARRLTLPCGAWATVDLERGTFSYDRHMNVPT